MHHSQPLFVYYGLLLFLCRRTTLFSPLFLLVMAARRTLSSDPQFLLDLMHDLPDESDSEDDFDGYLEPDDGPVAYRREEFEERGRRCCSRRRSYSLESLTEIGQGPAPDLESPLAGCYRQHPLPLSLCYWQQPLPLSLPSHWQQPLPM